MSQWRAGKRRGASVSLGTFSSIVTAGGRLQLPVLRSPCVQTELRSAGMGVCVVLPGKSPSPEQRGKICMDGGGALSASVVP